MATYKTNWKSTDYYNADDFNRIKANLESVKSKYEDIGYTISNWQSMTSVEVGKDIRASELSKIPKNIYNISNSSFKFSFITNDSFSGNEKAPNYKAWNKYESLLQILDKLANDTNCMSLNISGNSVKTDAIYLFDTTDNIDILYTMPIKLKISKFNATENANCYKLITFTFDSGAKALFEFDGKKLICHSDSNIYIKTEYFKGDDVAKTENVTDETKTYTINDIFDFGDNSCPSGGVWQVETETSLPFIRQIYYAMEKSEIPTSDDADYNKYDSSKNSVYVRPDGKADGTGQVRNAIDHILTTTLIDLKNACDLED